MNRWMRIGIVGGAAAVLVVLGGCGGSSGTSAFGPRADDTTAATDSASDTGSDSVADSGGETAAPESDQPSQEPKPSATPVVEPTPIPLPTATPAPIGKPTPTPAPPPTVGPTSPPVPVIADPRDSIVAGDCVVGLDAGDPLAEVPCTSADAEGQVSRVSRSSAIDCPNADIALGQSATSAAGVTTEYGFCINRIVALNTVFSDIDGDCEPAELDRREAASTVCDRENYRVFFVRLQPGTKPRPYLNAFEWDRRPREFGTWSLGDIECGTVFSGRNDGFTIFVSTFDRADYAVWHLSSELNADRLADQLSFRLDASLCPRR